MTEKTEKEHQQRTCNRLEIAIQAIGVPQAKICKEFNISPSRLGNWLAGTHYPNPFFLAQLCDRYGITMDWIYREQVAGVAGPLGDALWAAIGASSEESVVAAAQAPDPDGKKRGRKPKRETTGT